MHCLLIHHVFLGADSAGGTRHYEFAKHCVDNGDEFTVIACDVSYLDARKYGKERKRETIDGIRVVRASMPGFIHKSYFWRMIAFFVHMFSSFWHGLWQKKVDVVMGTSPSLFQACSAFLISVIRRKPFLLEIRDLWPDFAIELGVLKSKILIWMARRVENTLYRFSTHILVNSPAYVDYLVGKGVPREKISLISNGVDPDMFDPNEKGEAIRNEFQLQDKFVVVYAGAMGPANDIPTIIRAADCLRNEKEIHFLLIGGGKAMTEVESLIEELKLENVTLGGTKPKSEMQQVLGAADACVATLKNIPMFTTTYPNKIFDYMAAAKPTILGIDGVIRKVIEDGKAGVFVNPGNDEELAEQVLYMKQNPEVAAEMGRSGREYVIEHFNRRVHAEEFQTLLHRIVDDRRKK